MSSDTDFELTRLLRLLTERLVPGCLEQGLAAEDIAGLTKEISFEGEKIYIEVMKVMCRGYSDEHMRRYLEVHLSGAEHLRERAEGMLSKAGAVCVQLFEAFKQVLEGVLSRLGNWKKRYFGDGTELDMVVADDLMRPKEVMALLDVSEKTLYNYTVAGMFEYRQIKGTKYYVRSSVLGFKGRGGGSV